MYRLCYFYTICNNKIYFVSLQQQLCTTPMKRLLAYLAAISIVALVASCLNTLEPDVSIETEEGEVLDITNDEAIATARAHYERYKQTSRVVCGREM